MTLEEALQSVELEPGKTYRCRVRGHVVQVQVIEPRTEPIAIEDEGKIDPWTELPLPNPVGRKRSRLVAPPPPDVPEIPADDELP